MHKNILEFTPSSILEKADGRWSYILQVNGVPGFYLQNNKTKLTATRLVNIMKSVFIETTTDLRKEVTDQWIREVKKVENQFLTGHFRTSKLSLKSFLISIVGITKVHDNFAKQSEAKRNEFKEALGKIIKHLRGLLKESSILFDEIPEHSKFMDEAKIALSFYENIFNSMYRRGRPYSYALRATINMIISILRYDRGNILPPQKNGRKNLYSGEVLDFVLAIEPLLGQLGVQFGTDGSLGTDGSIGQTIINFMKED